MKQNIFLLFMIVTPCAIQATMHMHKGFIELFKRDPVITEFKAYTLFSEHPLEAAVNYLAFPWAVFINTGQLNKVPDITLNGGFTICQHISYEKIIPILKRIGIDTLFTPHVPKDKKYEGLTVLPFPHYPVNGISPAPTKDILYSFVGWPGTHQVRKKLMKLPKADDVVLIDRSNWHFWTGAEKQNKKEYQDILARSRFSLCPRGTGASTIRFWESMQAGAIPILISDAMALPTEIDWASCCIRVKEDQAHLVDDIIRSIPLEVEQELRAHCLATFDLFYGDNFVRTIRCHYQEL